MAYPNRPPPPPPIQAPQQEMGSTNIAFNTQIRLDLSYITTPLGILRGVLLLFNIIGSICIGSSAFSSHPRGALFLTVSILGIIYTSSILYCYIFHIVEKFNNWMWLKIELFASLGLVFGNLVMSTVVVAFGSAAFSAAGFFGYLCMVMYGFEAFLRTRAMKAGEPAQGHVLASKQQHVVSPP